MARNYKKRAMKRKPAKAKRAARKRENNMDDHTMTHRLAGSITPVQGLTVSNYVYTYWSPSPQFNSPAQSQALFQSQEFNLYRNLYDQFRVNYISLRLIPRANVTDSIGLVVQNDSQEITQGKGVYYTVEDRDGIAPGYIGSLNKYASVKVSKLTSRLTRRYAPQNAKNTWFDCQDPAGLDDIQRSIGMKGGITIYAESLPEVINTLGNSVWADVEVLYNVTYRGKSMVSLSVNDDGSVTVSQELPADMEAPFVVKTQEGNITHLGAVDLSGNIIENP